MEDWTDHPRYRVIPRKYRDVLSDFSSWSAALQESTDMVAVLWLFRVEAELKGIARLTVFNEVENARVSAKEQLEKQDDLTKWRAVADLCAGIGHVVPGESSDPDVYDREYNRLMTEWLNGGGRTRLATLLGLE